MKFFVLTSLVIAGYLFGVTELDVYLLQIWQEYSHIIPAPETGVMRMLPGMLFLLGASLLGMSFNRRIDRNDPTRTG